MVPEPVELPVVPVLVEPVPVPRVLDAPRVRLLRAVVPRDERDCVALVPVEPVLEEVPVWPPIEPEVPVDMLPVLPVLPLPVLPLPVLPLVVPPMLPPAVPPVPPLVCAMAMLGMISAAAAIEVKIRIFLS
jgi:signal-induced proliferation-associated 1 like protein 3